MHAPQASSSHSLADSLLQCHFRVLNVKDTGLPQSRDRLILIAAQRGVPLPAFPSSSELASAHMHAAVLTHTAAAAPLARSASCTAGVSDTPERNSGVPEAVTAAGLGAAATCDEAAEDVSDTAEASGDAHADSVAMRPGQFRDVLQDVPPVTNGELSGFFVLVRASYRVAVRFISDQIWVQRLAAELVKRWEHRTTGCASSSPALPCRATLCSTPVCRYCAQSELACTHFMSLCILYQAC